MASSSDISSAVLSKDSSSTPSSHRRFTQDQTSTLEKFYAEKQQASVEEKKDLVEATGLSHQQVRKWFENKRRTERRQRLKASGNAVKAIQNIEIEHVQESSTLQPSNVSEIKGLPAITPEVMETFKLLLADSITSVLQQLANQTTTSLQSLNVGVQTSNSGLIEHFPVPEGAFKDMSKGFDVDPELLDAAINDALVAEIQKPTKEMSIEFEPKRGKFSHQQLERLQKSFEVSASLLPEVRSKLSVELGLTNKQVTRWFQNRRHVKRKAESSSIEGPIDKSSASEEESMAKKAKTAEMG